MKRTTFLPILKRLVSFQTTSNHPDAIDACFAYIQTLLAPYPLIVHRYKHNGHVSMIWSTKPDKHAHIILQAHCDVVPAPKHLFVMKKYNSKLFGRGVSDMKFAIALYIAILKHIFESKKPIPSLSLMITSDEEIGGTDGVGYLVNSLGYTGDVVLLPDGGDIWHMVEESKGVIHLHVHTKGKTAHASKPWKGTNAIDSMINHLKTLHTLFPASSANHWNTTINIGRINGGTQINQVPDTCDAYLDIRYPHTENKKEIMKRISDIFGKNHVTEITHAKPFHCDKNNRYVNIWKYCLTHYGKKSRWIKEHGASDGRYFSEKNIPVIITKPTGGDIHSDHEWMDCDELERYADIVQKFITTA